MRRAEQTKVFHHLAIRRCAIAARDTDALIKLSAGFTSPRQAGTAAVHRFGGGIGLGEQRLDTIKARFGRWNLLSIFLTRWLLTPLALPVNVLAALGQCPLPTFVLASLVGELFWAAIYIGSGYVFGANWPAVADLLGDGGVLIVGAALAILAVMIAITAARRPSRV